MSASRSVRGARSWVLAAALMAGVTAAGCGGKTPPAQRPVPPTVSTAIAERGAIAPSQTLAGIVAPYNSVAIQSTLTEPADEVNVRAGDRAYRGEVLAVLDTADLRAALQADLATAASDAATTTHNIYQGSLSIAQGSDAVRTAASAVRQAQATLVKDQTDLSRYRQLMAKGFASAQQEADQAATVRVDEQAERSAVAALASAQSNQQANGTLASGGLQSSTIAQSRATEQVALANARQERVQISKATIVSPIDGVVVNRNFNPGEYPGNRQLFTIQQIEPIYAMLRGSAAQIADIQTGAAASITTSDASRRHLIGRVAGVLNEIAPGSTDFQVEVVLHNPGERLRPGMAVLGNVALPRVWGVRIPVTAFTDDAHDRVMAVRNGTVHIISVGEVADDGNTAVITGLPAGTRVVRDGQSSVGNGERVAIR